MDINPDDRKFINLGDKGDDKEFAFVFSFYRTLVFEGLIFIHDLTATRDMAQKSIEIWWARRREFRDPVEVKQFLITQMQLLCLDWTVASGKPLQVNSGLLSAESSRSQSPEYQDAAKAVATTLARIHLYILERPGQVNSILSAFFLDARPPGIIATQLNIAPGEISRILAAETEAIKRIIAAP